MTFSAENLIWVDLEMTGLDPEKERIIEMAVIITDTYLNIIAESPVITVHQSDDLLNAMDAWNTKQHNSSGLVARVKESQVTEVEAEAMMLQFLKQYVPAGKSPMCGNTVYQDRRFLHRYMPELEKYFHYRLLDVSTLKELAFRWAPEVYAGVKKESKHLALEDIRESIEELKYYRTNLLRQEVINN